MPKTRVRAFPPVRAARAPGSPPGMPRARWGFAAPWVDLAVDPVLDPNTGLVYLRARWYDPSTGQFLSVDPLVAQTQQPYQYGGDDPINETDPTGLCGDTSSWGSFWANCGSEAVKTTSTVLSATSGAVGTAGRLAVAACKVGIFVPATSEECAAVELVTTVAGGVATVSDTYKALSGDPGAEIAVPLDVIGLAAPFDGKAIARLGDPGVGGRLRSIRIRIRIRLRCRYRVHTRAGLSRPSDCERRG